MNGNNIFDKLDNVKRKYPEFSTKQYCWFEILEILDKERIHLFKEHLPRDINAWYFCGESGPHIMVDLSLEETHEGEFALCHELGHHFLHGDIIDINTGNIELDNKHEVEAELFAFMMYNPRGTAAHFFWEALLGNEYENGFYTDAYEILTIQRKLLIKNRRWHHKSLGKPNSRAALDRNIRTAHELAGTSEMILQYRDYLNELSGIYKKKRR